MAVFSGCSSVSSNCVVWQGPNIACINLTKGDSITEAVESLATQLCALSLPNVDITGVDFKCLIDQVGTEPSIIADAFQLVVDKHCELKDVVDNIIPGSDPSINLSACLQTGGVTSLPVSEYVAVVAAKVCENVTAIQDLQSQIDTLENRVTDLEAAIALIDPSITLPTVDTSCLGGAAGVQLEIGLQTTIDELCALKTVLGSNSDLISSISAECVGLAESDALSQEGIMSDIVGWVDNPTTIADTIKNMWLTICDLREKQQEITTEILPKCKDVDLDFEVNFSANRETAELQLFRYAYIPDVFSNKITSNVTFTDGVTTFTDQIDVVMMSNVSGMNVTYSTVAMGLDLTANIKVTVEANLTTPDGDCDKLKTKDYDYQCLIAAPTSLAITPTIDGGFMSWTSPATAEPVIRYEFQILAAGNIVRNGESLGNNITISGLDPGVQYEFRVKAIFACGISEAVVSNFDTACYTIVSANADFGMCMAGSEYNLGGEIVISAPAEQEISFALTVFYWDPSFSTGCDNNIDQQDIFGKIPIGETIGVINRCSSGYEIEGAKVCYVRGELLNGCSTGTTVEPTCPTPTGLTVTIL